MVSLAGRERLVGCTRYCTHPASSLDGVTRIGGTKNPELEKILGLAPDLVLGNAEENREEDLQWLAQRVPVLVQTPCTVAQSADCLRELGEALGASERAESIAGRLSAAAQSSPVASPVRVLYLIWCKPWMSINHTTYIHDVLRLTGASNVCAGRQDRYPVIDVPEVVAAGVDLVLLPDEPWVFDEAQAQDLAARGCFGAARVMRCSGRDFCWHGVHATVGLERARALLEPARA
ncbi:MAG: ABC transporter substrate-binding protein [Planctomycetes bacterium]|nr:ABC transporter substrate-binding protein [Planctomycetota bacterium]MCB9886227.1 ABC transporter substrate-binding protein [Planctomycetota bacterium]